MISKLSGYLCWAGGSPESAVADQDMAEDLASDGEDSEGEDAGAAGQVTAGEAADSLANLEQEKTLQKSLLAELDGMDDEDGAQEVGGHCFLKSPT